VPAAAIHNDRVHAEKQHARNEALALRIRGMTAPQIAKQLGVSTPTVYRYIDDAFKEIPRVNAQTALKLKLEQLDQLALQAYVQLQKSDLKHSDRARYMLALSRISDQQCRLEGLYAPEKHEHSVVDRVNASSVREMTEEDLRRVSSGDFGALNGSGRVQ
jgi:AcrR family transcriptional regulator